MVDCALAAKATLKNITVTKRRLADFIVVLASRVKCNAPEVGGLAS